LVGYKYIKIAGIASVALEVIAQATGLGVEEVERG
jgi:hypothetical protein